MSHDILNAFIIIHSEVNNVLQFNIDMIILQTLTFYKTLTPCCCESGRNGWGTRCRHKCRPWRPSPPSWEQPRSCHDDMLAAGHTPPHCLAYQGLPCSSESPGMKKNKCFFCFLFELSLMIPTNSFNYHYDHNDYSSAISSKLCWWKQILHCSFRVRFLQIKAMFCILEQMLSKWNEQLISKSKLILSTSLIVLRYTCTGRHVLWMKQGDHNDNFFYYSHLHFYGFLRHHFYENITRYILFTFITWPPNIGILAA